ncbi:sensor histidine kinase [Gordonia sp. SL306]|uniref:sensor histidine kinase n=1 Tax=Gordonia sp. SL306 TaxID=2995145 RepID=UPI00226E2333|nr:HAMP domain-containing sensor histidine kinase [Gordonia sp. SL306]WAC54423.1 HAMP domain-containing sensor histidine kinase [Gordonia sp. SL306]
MYTEGHQIVAITRKGLPHVNRRRGGVRAQSTIIAAAVVTLALAVGGMAMLFMLHRANNEAMYRSTGRQAYQIASAIDRSGIPGVDTDDLAPGAGVDVIQVIDASGRVVRSSPGAPSRPIISVDQAPHTYRYFDNIEISGFAGEFCATAVGAEHDDEYYTVLALDRATGVRHSEWVTGIILAAEIPLLVVVAAGAVYLLVGRSLRPVSRITKRVNEITATALGQRVPVPSADDEITTLATTMNDMLSRLENARDAQLRFVADASHELRSPLTTIVGILDLADDTDSAVDLPTVRTILLPEAKRMQVMVDDLLMLARADENGLTLNLDEIDLDDVVAAEVGRVRSLGSARIRLHVKPIRMIGDSDKITRALRNVIDNAVRHAQSTVSVSMRIEGDDAVVTVADDGSGIPVRDRDVVFQRFARLDVDRRNQFGAGLGLAIVREIARAHGGSASIGESDTGGAAVTITLPLSVSMPVGHDSTPPARTTGEPTDEEVSLNPQTSQSR